MKKYKSLLDALIIGLLILISAVTIAPDTLVMPSALQMAALATAFALVSGFVVLVWRESPQDEREAENMHLGSRNAYLAGCAVLIVVMLVQGIRHKLDAAVPIILLIMILTKLLSQMHRDKK